MAVLVIITNQKHNKPFIQNPELADYLYQKIRLLCPPRWVVHEEDDEHMGPFSKGEWELSSRLDSRIQIYHYKPGGVFEKHTDGATFHSADRRSLFTVLVYLNDGYEGGHTTVYTDDETKSYKVPKGMGSCFAMLQRTLHEGSVVESGEKWALRCDVLYDRIGGTSAEESVKHLSDKSKAKLYYDLASKMELSGYAEESLPYYRKAYRLDPNLEEV
eukprot:TRINITY_DN5169_c0_g1_i1.p1 TRINITY_DN5169_c0_g1~~TRINITY_DN5169_c0_g1_i1.p1  ORF type:complete len:216 (+),score=39.49 TRINITY_DN5169_c0_g1_i1:50-697(+)